MQVSRREKEKHRLKADAIELYAYYAILGVGALVIVGSCRYLPRTEATARLWAVYSQQ